ncbi:MAG: phytanoyl-CoA dioxygenase family protein [Armatimonadota bacterium]|nr:phytanoyl-CoA dioxygenase family protein [Armatimonadota bacterium]
MIQTKLEPIADGTVLPWGDQTLTFGKDVFELTDSSDLLRAGDFDGLRARLAEDGHLFIRGFHPRDKALAAQESVLKTLDRLGALAPDTDWHEGLVGPENKSFAFFRAVEVAHAPEVLALTDGPHTFGFYEELLGGPVATMDKRWLRAMAHGGSNFFHYDSAYVGRGTLRRYTMWSALTDISLENGPLAVALGSHKDEKLKATYGLADMDLDLIDPVFSADPHELVEKFHFPLATTNFQAGDVLLFGLHFMHSSIPNRLHKYRISIDTRYQLASELRDERFYGQNGEWLGNGYNKDAKYRPMAELRKLWGLE